MPLEPCRDCGKEMSSEANACPHCGARSRKTQGEIVGCSVLTGIAVVAALFFIVNVCGP